MPTDASPAPPAPAAAAPARSSWLTTLGWSAYLACSWTWCIGMFLPVLLVRDFGIWGFVVFAVPNVLGAGAMGWVIGRVQSEHLVRRHGVACRAFSLVTIAFQVFFASWLGTVTGSDGGLLVPVFILIGLPILVSLGPAPIERARLAAAVVWTLSTVAFVVMLSLGLLPPAPRATPLRLPEIDLFWLTPVCAFGFGLCPYLDLTFQAARSSQDDRGARRSFALGFGALFPVMLLFTLAYAGLFPADHPMQWWLLSPSLTMDVVTAHISVQAIITVVLHVRERKFAAADLRGGRLHALVLALVAGGLLGVGARYLPAYAKLDAAELIYRLFMAFYGLVFPAYVWLCVIPTRDGHSGPSRGKMLVWLIAVIVAAPMFWMGFIERVTWWLGPGLGVVLVARLVLPRAKPALAGEPRSQE